MTLYAIFCADAIGWTEYDELWGNERRVFATREEAEQKAFYFLADGEWGNWPPRYVVREIDAESYLQSGQDLGIVDDIEAFLSTKTA